MTTSFTGQTMATWCGQVSLMLVYSVFCTRWLIKKHFRFPCSKLKKMPTMRWASVTMRQSRLNCFWRNLPQSIKTHQKTHCDISIKLFQYSIIFSVHILILNVDIINRTIINLYVLFQIILWMWDSLWGLSFPNLIIKNVTTFITNDISSES